MAIATNGGHTARAVDFMNSAGKYFAVGGTQPWEDETSPTTPQVTDFSLIDIVALKKVDHAYLVIPSENGTITYRGQNWKIVPNTFSTTTTGPVTSGSYTIPLANVQGLVQGSKVRVAGAYEFTIAQEVTGNTVTLDQAIPTNLPTGTTVMGGALVEGSKYVYLDCTLEGDVFPICTYRQIGLYSGVQTNVSNDDILESASYSSSNHDEWTNLGMLEIIDNRIPATRTADSSELLSLIIEF